MNISEQAIIAAIGIAVSASILWLGGKAFDQVEQHSSLIASVSVDDLDSPVQAQLARLEAERAERIARKQAAHLGN